MQINPIQQSFQALPIKPNITKSSIITSTILLSTILGSAYLMQDRKYNESCTKIENLNVLNLPSTSIENLVKTYGLEDLSIEEIDFGSYRFSAKTGLMEKIEGEVHTIPNEQNEYFGTITKSGIFEDETYEFVLQQKQNYNNNVVNMMIKILFFIF